MMDINNTLTLFLSPPLQKETINHDDIVGAIGPRPFEAHKEYAEFIESIKPVKSEEESPTTEG